VVVLPSFVFGCYNLFWVIVFEFRVGEIHRVDLLIILSFSPLSGILFVLLLICRLDSCRGEYTGSRSFILSFSPL